jgi:hypothetical protein
MKWYPGYASAPHSYATDRLSLARLRMLAHDYPFDTVQMPLNCFDGTYRSFEQQVLPELGRRGIAALAGSSPDPGDVPQDHACLAERRYLSGGASFPMRRFCR